MKPMGKHKTLIENNCRDFKVKGPTYKKYKHMERQQAKKAIDRYQKASDFLSMNDMEKEVAIRELADEMSRKED